MWFKIIHTNEQQEKKNDMTNIISSYFKRVSHDDKTTNQRKRLKLSPGLWTQNANVWRYKSFSQIKDLAGLHFDKSITSSQAPQKHQWASRLFVIYFICTFIFCRLCYVPLSPLLKSVNNIDGDNGHFNANHSFKQWSLLLRKQSLQNCWL